MLIELAQEIGINPRRASSTEYNSVCPACNGTDRFIIWPKKDRYWCRRCRKSGDPIQFCRDFMGMSFREACEKVGEDKMNVPYKMPDRVLTDFFPPKAWVSKATQFVESCHQRLLIESAALRSLSERGLSMRTIREYSIGLNPVTSFPWREDWGLSKKIEDGKEKKLWMPAGFTIPTFQDKLLRKIKIRCSGWKEGSNFGKYYIVPGSSDLIPIFGDPAISTVVVVEAEFDAMLVVQEAGELCCCIALGGAQKRPNASLNAWLRDQRYIIFALDFDEAGKKEYAFWRSAYPSLQAWPVPMGKSPEEAWRQGVNLRSWIISGISQRNTSHCFE